MDKDGCLVSFFSTLCIVYGTRRFSICVPKDFSWIRDPSGMCVEAYYQWMRTFFWFFFIWFICRFAMRSGDVLACVYFVPPARRLTSKRVRKMKYTHTHIIEATDAWAEMFWLKSAIKKQCFTTSQINDNHTGRKTNSTVPAAHKYMNGWSENMPPQLFESVRII